MRVEKMKKEEILQKLGSYKEKLVNLQVKINRIERMAQYKDAEVFDYYKGDLELLLTTIELSLTACELSVNRTYSLYAEGFITEPDKYAEEEVKRSIKEVNKEIKGLQGLITKAIN